MSEHLFVYGTLRKGYDLKLMGKVNQLISYVGQGKVNADLYDLGRYPGAIRSSRGPEVIGDVFELSDPERVLRTLDRYEGIGPDETASEFVRRKSRIKLRSGKTVTAWVYWYNQEPAGKIRIRHKNYLNYLKNKRAH
ncbi:MAG TPA: gamma-glutamylcyclotransferase family protein [Puia sp.]|nr:gamma-glutamylcyclotransferase family protein [Puia sp.]